MSEAQRQLRVLHVTSSIASISGGTAAAVVGLAQAQAGAGMDVRVAATWVTTPGPESIAKLEAAGVKVRSIQAFNPMSRSPEIRPIVEEMAGDVDVVHVHGMWEQIQHEGPRAARRRGVPYVYTPHGMLDPWNMTKSAMKKKLVLALRMRKNLNGAAVVHFATEIERDWTSRLKLRPRTLVEPFGVDLREFQSLPPRGALRAKYPQIGDRQIVMFLGRLHAGKGLELLIPAMVKVKDATLVIVGPDSGYRATAEAEIERLGLRDRVIFTGMMLGEERVAALVDADLLALPSYHENFGIVVVESLAAGTPVVVSDQVGLHRTITQSRLGGVSPMNVESLAGELTRWLSDENLRRDAVAAARPFVFEHFDWDKIACRWADHYRHLS